MRFQERMLGLFYWRGAGFIAPISGRGHEACLPSVPSAAVIKIDERMNCLEALIGQTLVSSFMWLHDWV